MHECYHCQNRTVYPNCHDPKRCEKWAAHVERQKALYAKKEDDFNARHPRPPAKYDKSSNYYYYGSKN